MPTILEIGGDVLALAIKLYPEIAALLSSARASGTLSESTAAAVERILPEQSESAKALAEVKAG